MKFSNLVCLALLFSFITACSGGGGGGSNSGAPAPVSPAGNQNPTQDDPTPAPTPRPVMGSAQPSPVTLSGAAVMTDGSAPEAHIQYSESTGNGGSTPVGQANQASLSATFDDSINPSLLGYMKDVNNIIAVGCDATFVNQISHSKSLPIKKIPAVTDGKTEKIYADTVILCGNLKEINFPMISILAKEIILKAISFTTNNDAGYLSMTSNKLTLMGYNQIRSVGPSLDTATSRSTNPFITINVANEVDADDSSRLMIYSEGPSYRP